MRPLAAPETPVRLAPPARETDEFCFADRSGYDARVRKCGSHRVWASRYSSDSLRPQS
jgi:hypothetical protein